MHIWCTPAVYAANGDVFLFALDGESANVTKGTLQIRFNDEDYFVCLTDGFNQNAADAACRQLGFVDAKNFEKEKDP